MQAQLIPPQQASTSEFKLPPMYDFNRDEKTGADQQSTASAYNSVSASFRRPFFNNDEFRGGSGRREYNVLDDLCRRFCSPIPIWIPYRRLV